MVGAGAWRWINHNDTIGIKPKGTTSAKGVIVVATWSGDRFLDLAVKKLQICLCSSTKWTLVVDQVLVSDDYSDHILEN